MTRLKRSIAVFFLTIGMGMLGVAGTAVAQDQSFGDWLVELRAEASSKGISDATLDAALNGIAPIPRVIELDQKQPEFTLTFAQYLDRVVPQSRKDRARARYNKHQDLLEMIGKKYGVQPRFVVALWGIETDFGRVLGGFDVIPALATLAHDGRRSAFFRKELLDALTIIDQGHVSADDMKGSWAGAMGQSQFMPSSFRRYAQDYDGDGRQEKNSDRPFQACHGSLQLYRSRLSVKRAKNNLFGMSEHKKEHI